MVKAANQNRTIEILLVEDNPGDVLLTQEAFEKSSYTFNITVAEDGEKALAIAGKQNDYKNQPDFDLILLDLNLPKKNGIEVIKELKNDPSTTNIPVIMLSSSKQQIDIVKSYQLKANSYIIKPSTEAEYDEIVKAIEICWFNALNKKM